MIHNKLLLGYFLAALTVLGLNLFAVSPAASQHLGNFLGNGIYIGVRLATLVGFTFLLCWSAQRPRFSAIRITTFLVFIEQVIFKGIFLSVDFSSHPAQWEGVDHQAAFFSLIMSYAISIPFVLLIAFLGTELSEVVIRFKKPSTST